MSPRTMRIAALLGVVLALGACSRGPHSAADAPATTSEAGADGSMVRLRLDRSRATPADRLTLRIERIAAPGWIPLAADAELRVDEQLGAFTIAEVRQEPPIIDEEGRRVDAVEYVLLPFLPGREEIPAMEWGFALSPDARSLQSPPAAPLVIRTEPIEVTILSLLESHSAALSDAKGVVDAPPPPLWPWIAGAGAATAILTGIAALVALRRRSGPTPEPEIPPHEEALSALASLARLGLPEKGEFDPYFTELSRILRRYIERRFDLHAPMLTTDEFLQRSRSSAAIRAEFVRDLEKFLRLADLVKFARHAPLLEEAGHAHDTARAFVEATAQVEPAPGVPSETRS